MASFKVVITSSAEAEFREVPFPFRRQINQRIMRLKDVPHPPDCEFLSEEICRLPIHGWHLLYAVNDAQETVTIQAVLKG